MAATFAPNTVLGGRVSLNARARCLNRKAFAAPARVASKARHCTTRAVKEVAGADFQKEVLDVREPPSRPRPEPRLPPTTNRSRSRRRIRVDRKDETS
jgi:hypothetical protein